MNSFDKGILLLLNSYVGRWPLLDAVVVLWQRNNLLSNAVFLAVICGLWFKVATTKRQQLENRQTVFATFCATLTAIAIARLLAHLLPFRVRPAFAAELDFSVPAHANISGLLSWSAFPSDHAVVWFALATGILLSDRSFGVLAVLCAGLNCLMRVYMGYHSPTDVIGGAVIGCALTWTLARRSVRTALWVPFEGLEVRSPGLFYCAAFLALYEMSNMFDDVRAIATWAIDYLHVV